MVKNSVQIQENLTHESQTEYYDNGKNKEIVYELSAGNKVTMMKKEMIGMCQEKEKVKEKEKARAKGRKELHPHKPVPQHNLPDLKDLLKKLNLLTEIRGGSSTCLKTRTMTRTGTGDINDLEGTEGGWTPPLPASGWWHPWHPLTVALFCFCLCFPSAPGK